MKNTINHSVSIDLLFPNVSQEKKRYLTQVMVKRWNKKDITNKLLKDLGL